MKKIWENHLLLKGVLNFRWHFYEEAILERLIPEKGKCFQRLDYYLKTATKWLPLDMRDSLERSRISGGL